MPYIKASERRVARRVSYRKRKERILTKEKEYRKHHPDRYRWLRRKVRYGITEKDYQRMLEQQRGLCALCAKNAPTDIDHDHISGRTRGLLCRPCNLGLGMFGDTIDGLLRAIDYLRRYTIGPPQ